MAHKSIEQRRQYWNKWYAANKGKVKTHYVAKTKRRRHEAKTWLEIYKSSLKCLKCGERRVCCLDFHHLEPQTKDRPVSAVIGDGCSKARILHEIEKCLVLCANCHRALHYDEKMGLPGFEPGSRDNLQFPVPNLE
jgi:hypothetical protein